VKFVDHSVQYYNAKWRQNDACGLYFAVGCSSSASRKAKRESYAEADC
jgi:hypothetical protein